MTHDSSQRLPTDLMRSILAGILAVLAFGGQAYSLAQPELRAHLGEQSMLRWTEQLDGRQSRSMRLRGNVR